MVEKSLAEVKLTEAGKIRAGSYSGGMKRRLSVAVSLIGDPKLVFLDEPVCYFQHSYLSCNTYSVDICLSKFNFLFFLPCMDCRLQAWTRSQGDTCGISYRKPRRVAPLY